MMMMVPETIYSFVFNLMKTYNILEKIRRSLMIILGTVSSSDSRMAFSSVYPASREGPMFI